MVEVDREFIKDKQNLIKLKEICGSQGKAMDKKRFKKAIKMIASTKVPSEEELQVQTFIDLNQDAFDLYGRVHFRYVQTPAGLAKLY